MVLQVYNGDADAVNMLDELKDSYHKLSEKKKPSTQGGAETLVEIILTLVAKPALLFRRIGPHVFSACCANINEPALESMTQVCKVF
jgi:DNA polymerase phi